MRRIPTLPRVPVTLALAAALLATGGCAIERAADEPRQYLDEGTAATITVAAEPLVFARERPELAVNARDYLTLVPVDVNRAGAHTVYFYGYVWSTIDKRGTGEQRAGTAAGGFELVADGRRISLGPAAKVPRELGFGRAPLEPPAHDAATLVASVGREALDFLVGASDVRAVRTTDGIAEGFDLWRDGRPAIADFLEQVPVSAR